MSPPPLDVVLVGPARFGVHAPFAGGLESFVATLASGLTRRGHRVRVVAGTRPPVSADRSRRDVPSDDADEADDGRSIREAVLATLAQRPADVVHHNGAASELLDLSDVAPHFELTLHTPPLRRLGDALVARPGISLSTPSDSNADRWSAAIGRRPTVIHNGVDRAVFVPGTRCGGYLAWVGRIVPEKGLHVAIEAARLLELPLRVAGPIHDPAYFDEQIRPSIGSGVHYEGHLAPVELAALLASAAVTLVTPLWPEPFGLVVAESLACGTPVAAFANGSLDGGGTFSTSAVQTTRGRTPADLVAAALRASGTCPEQCRAASAPFDLEAMVTSYEQRYQAAPAPVQGTGRGTAQWCSA